MSKFRVKITRTEVYEQEVEVEAEDARAAIAKARENEQNNEYAELFDCPDNVKTDFSYAGAGEKRVVDIAPFTTMEISAKVDWDSDEGDTDLPDRSQTLTLTADELKVNEVVDVGDIQDRCWTLDEDKLEEYVSDRLTDETGYCHNGFTFDYKINKGE